MDFQILLYLVLMLQAVGSGVQTEAITRNPEYRLFQHIFNGTYNKFTRPPSSTNLEDHGQVRVEVWLQLRRIMSIDNKAEISNAFFLMIESWCDPRLTWNPQDFGNITEISVPVTEIWIPDTFIPNAIIVNQDDKVDKTHAKIGHQTCWGAPGALVSLYYPADFQQFCRVRMKYYPFDVQVCTMFIVSKSHHISRLMFYTAEPEVDATGYYDAGEWSLIRATVRPTNTTCPACAFNNHSSLLITVVAKRQSLYYVLNLFVPTTAICILSTMGLFANAGQSDSVMDTVTLGLTTLLSLGVLLLTVSDQTPKGSQEISLLAVFFTSMILQVMIATIISTYLQVRSTDHSKVQPSKIDGGTSRTTTGHMQDKGNRTRWFWLIGNQAFIIIVVAVILGLGYTNRPERYITE